MTDNKLCSPELEELNNHTFIVYQDFNTICTDEHENETSIVSNVSETDKDTCDYRNDEIDIITSFLSKLESIPFQEQSIDYQQIVHLAQDFLKKNCKHVLVMDTIDIDPDRSQNILYCIKCGFTIHDRS